VPSSWRYSDPPKMFQEAPDAPDGFRTCARALVPIWADAAAPPQMTLEPLDRPFVDVVDPNVMGANPPPEVLDRGQVEVDGRGRVSGLHQAAREHVEMTPNVVRADPLHRTVLKKQRAQHGTSL